MDSDILLAKLTQASGDGVGGRVTDRNGEYVCYLGPYPEECQLGAAGIYTITVSLYYGTGTGSYKLSVESTRTPSECEKLPEKFFSFASAGRTGTLPAGAAGHCYKFNQPTGAVLHLAGPGGAGDVQGSILDAQYKPLCQVRYTTECTLSRPGPYRLFLRELYGNETAYTLKMPRISHAAGCPVVPLASFGDPGTNVGTGTVAQQDEVACHALTTTTAGAVVVRFAQHHDQYLWWYMYGPDGQRICEEYSSARYCALPAAGTYTLLVQHQNIMGTEINYQVAVTALNRNDGCAQATGTSWDQPALLVHQTSAVQTNCQPFQGQAGDQIITYAAPTVYNEVSTWLVDDAGVTLCTEWSERDGCVLPATGTYRVISYLRSWNDPTEDHTYKMQVRRLSDAAGCPTVTPGTYGAAPASALGGIRCRILDIPASGVYRVKAVDAQNYRSYARVYDSAGARVCDDMWCNFPAPGRYTMVLAGAATTTVIDNDFRYAVALLPYVPSGCDPVSETGYQEAPYRGEFVAAGQHDCLQLPSPAGARIVALLPGDATGAGMPEIAVLDSTGAYLCDSSWSLRQYSCELTGTAPFFAVLNADDGDATGSYAVAFARVDGAPSCPVLPRDATGVTVTTGADRFAACFSIPADQHAAREVFTYRRTSGEGDARLSVFDGGGVRYCGPTGPSVDRTVTCSLPAGPVMVILETDAVDATYQLTHRDATTPAP
ncbi:hypothetical protein [Micromonospora pattaloongensis]|uniref:hypothetical protein n=1 Tax=Micromonospora pattaloongensis TaxID=405436 RepID=UPI0011151558|nr:hypothetical protein [Micromonospora pattaloongensis]